MRGALGASDVRQWYLAVTNIAAVDAHPLGLAFGFFGLAPPMLRTSCCFPRGYELLIASPI